jgi:hypothetical protein
MLKIQLSERTAFFTLVLYAGVLFSIMGTYADPPTVTVALVILLS